MWKIRNGRSYRYETVRTGDRVVTRYIPGSGTFSFSILAEARRRAELRAAISAWLPVRHALETTEREVVRADVALGELADAALLAAGYRRRNRGRWRKRRVVSGGGSGDPTAGISTLLGLLDRLGRAKGSRREKLEAESRTWAAALMVEARANKPEALPVLGTLVFRRPDLLVSTEVTAFAADLAIGSDGRVEFDLGRSGGPLPWRP